MKIYVEINDLKYMFKVLKPALSKKDYPMPALKFIQLNCKDNIITAYATDSYRMHSVKIPCTNKSDDCQMLIPIVEIPKEASRVVEITNDGQYTTFNFETEQKIIQNQNLNYPQVESVIPEGEPEYQVAFNPKYLKDAASVFSKEDTIILNFYGKTKPCIIKPRKADAEDFCLVLPVRIKENNQPQS